MSREIAVADLSGLGDLLEIILSEVCWPVSPPKHVASIHWAGASKSYVQETSCRTWCVFGKCRN